MFFFMINFKGLLAGKWDNSIVFLKKNILTTRSATVGLSGELLDNLEKFLIDLNYYSNVGNSIKGTGTKSNSSLGNFLLTIVLVFKIIIIFLAYIVSIIPLTFLKFSKLNKNYGYTEDGKGFWLIGFRDAMNLNADVRSYNYDIDNTNYYFNHNEVLNRRELVFTAISSSLVNKTPSLNWKSNLSDINVYSLKKKLALNSINLNNSLLFKLSDYILLELLSNSYKAHIKNMSNFRYFFSMKQVNWNFYSKDNANKKFKINVNYFQNYYLIGLKSIWLGVRYWIVGILVSVSVFFYFLHLKALPFNKTVFGYFTLGMFSYYLITTYVFFVKKYQYSKYTSVIQRFWKRSFIIFWMIEASLFVTFFYLCLIAPEEPVYMYDQAKVYKTHLFSWRWFLVKIIPSVLLIMLGSYLQMTIRWGLFSRQNVLLLAITLLVIYIFWVEFYQFYHIVSFYGNFFWNYDYDEFLWTLELDDRRTRIVNNAVSITLIAKFWHIVFLFIFWVFFILRINELKRVRYQFMAANVQNFIILYIMSWAYMYPWAKFLLLKQMASPYYWFNLNFRRLGFRVFLTDIKLHVIAICNSVSLPSFNYIPFFYLHESSNLTAFSGHRKSSIKDHVIAVLHSAL